MINLSSVSDYGPALASLMKKSLSGQGGEALIVGHPFIFGISMDERIDQAKMAQEIQRLSGSEPLSLDRMLSVQEQYLQSLERYLNRSPLRVGIVFLSVGEVVGLTAEGQPMVIANDDRTGEHFLHLQKVDRTGRVWLTVPTQWCRATPLNGWQQTLDQIAEIGVKKAFLGGCYYLVSEGEPLHPERMYGCINDLEVTMAQSDRIKSVEVVRSMTYVHNLAAAL